MPIQVLDVRAQFAEQAAQTLKLLVAGSPGAGKTRMASTFPNVLYADAEGRLLSVRDRPVRAVKITSSKDMEELRNALDQRPEIREKLLGAPVDTIVLDTVDEIARILMRERLQAERKDAFTQPDWGIHGDKLRDILRSFRNLGDVHVILNVHVRAQTDEETGRVEYKPAIQGAVGHEIAEYVDECLLLSRRSRTDPRTGEKIIERYLQTYADSQYTWLKDHSGALPPEFPVDLNTDFERLSKLIFGSLPAPAASERVRESLEWTPERSGEGELSREKILEGVDLPEPEPERPRKKAAARKKAAPAEPSLEEARAVVNRDLVEQAVASGFPPPEDLARALSKEAKKGTEPPAEAPDTGVPEIGTEVSEPTEEPVEEPPAGPACAVCGETDIPKNYLLLSDARFEQTLCRVHFHERIDKK